MATTAPSAGSSLLNASSVTAVQGIGLITSAIGSYYAAEGQKAQQQYQSAIGILNAALAESDATLLDLNASISETQARFALMQGQREEQKVRLRTAQIKSTQRTAMAANGVDLGVGSAARVLASTDYMGELDAGQVRANAALQAFGYRVQATNQKFAAMSARTQGVNYRAGSAFAAASASGISPIAAATSTLIGGAGQVAQNWYRLNQVGAIP